MLLLFLLFSHPKAFPDWNSECFVRFMSDFRDCDCLHFFFLTNSTENIHEDETISNASKWQKFSWFTFPVCWCVRISDLLCLECQIVSLGTCPEIPLWKYFFLISSGSTRIKDVQAAYLVGVKDFSRPLFRTLPSDFSRSDKIIFQLQMKNETKSGLETKNFCEIFYFGE
jgi:hypothetical protein